MPGYIKSYIHKNYVTETSRTHNKFDIMLPVERYNGYKICLPYSAVKKEKDIYCLWYLTDSEFQLINVQEATKGKKRQKITGQELSDILIEGKTWYLAYDCDVNNTSFDLYNIKSYRIGYFTNGWFISDDGDIWNRRIKPRVIKEIAIADLDLVRGVLRELRALNNIVNSPANERRIVEEANDEYLKIINRKFESIEEQAFIGKLTRAMKKLDKIIADEYDALAQRLETGCRELCSGIN